MHKIATPLVLQQEIQRILEYSQTERPSREKLASALRDLADRVATVPFKVGPEPSEREIDEMMSLAGSPPFKVGPEPSEREIDEMMGKMARGPEGTWAKLRDGSWGVRMEVRARPGQSVTVRKKSGQTSVIQLGRQVWTDNKNVWLFSVGSSGSSSRDSGGFKYKTRRGPGGTYECEECGDYVKPGSICWETGARH